MRNNKSRYRSKARRDNDAAFWKAQGVKTRKSSARGQIISPNYVLDYDGPVTPNGFGGAAPQYFATLYILEID